MRHGRLVVVALLLAACSLAPAAAEDAPSWAVTAGVRYGIVADQTYLTADGKDSKLDLWVRRGASTPTPTVIYIHGGGWVRGSKEDTDLLLLPWLEQGWAVANVEYRMAPTALAPASTASAPSATRTRPPAAPPTR
jgi:acetyl esterase/lipase